jgi:hypothetical protein
MLSLTPTLRGGLPLATYQSGSMVVHLPAMGCVIGVLFIGSETSTVLPNPRH